MAVAPSVAVGQPKTGTPDSKQEYTYNFDYNGYLSTSLFLQLSAEGGGKTLRRLQVIEDVGTFEDNTGRRTTVVNTEAAARDFVYTFNRKFLLIGGGASFELPHGFSTGGNAAVSVGTVDLSYLNLVDETETSYDSSWGPDGVSAGWYLSTGGVGPPWLYLIGGVDYERVSADGVTRTPATTVIGGRVEAEQDSIIQRDVRAWLGAAVGRSLRRPKYNASATVGYLNAEITLERQLSLVSTQTVGTTVEFNGRTTLSKTGVYGTAGGSVALTDNFTFGVRGAFGAVSEFRLGVLFGFGR